MGSAWWRFHQESVVRARRAHPAVMNRGREVDRVRGFVSDTAPGRCARSVRGPFVGDHSGRGAPLVRLPQEPHEYVLVLRAALAPHPQHHGVSDLSPTMGPHHRPENVRASCPHDDFPGTRRSLDQASPGRRAPHARLRVQLVYRRWDAFLVPRSPRLFPPPSRL